MPWDKSPPAEQFTFLSPAIAEGQAVQHLGDPADAALPRPQKKSTHYWYSDQEKQAAVTECGATHEITRCKGLGEISAGVFKDFIGEAIRLDPINLHHLYSSDELL